MTDADISARNRRARAAGKRFESDLRSHLRDGGWDVESLRLTGKHDEGDLVVRLPDGRRLVIEAKAEARIDLSGYLREAHTEADNYAKARWSSPPRGDVVPAVIVKARGKGIGRSYFVMELDEVLPLWMDKE